MLTNRCDVHTHTLFSRHAYSTIRENVLAAAEQGAFVLAAARRGQMFQADAEVGAARCGEP